MAQVGIARSSGVPVWLVAVVAGLAAGVGWFAHGFLAVPPSGAGAAAPAMAEPALGAPPIEAPGKADCDPAAAAALRTEVADLKSQLGVLRLRLEEEASARREVEEQLAGAIAEARRYKQGAEAAVEELNRQARAAPRRTPARRSASPSISDLASYGSPRVQLSGDTVIVTGRIFNRGASEQHVNLRIELQLDGRTVSTGYVPLTLPARVATSYSYTFRGGFGEGTYSAVMRIQ